MAGLFASRTDAPTLANPNKPISRRTEQFCQEFLVDLNRSKAVLRAGFAPKAAYLQGYRMMKDPRILARINELMREREESTRVKGFKVLEELAVVALSSIDRFEIDAKGFVTTKDTAPAGAMGAVSRIRRKARVVETTRSVDGEGGCHAHERVPRGGGGDREDVVDHSHT